MACANAIAGACQTERARRGAVAAQERASPVGEYLVGFIEEGECSLLRYLEGPLLRVVTAGDCRYECERGDEYDQYWVASSNLSNSSYHL